MYNEIPPRTYTYGPLVLGAAICATLALSAISLHGCQSITPGPEKSAAVTPDAADPTLAAFFENHCYSCHGAKRQKGGIDFETPIEADGKTWRPSHYSTTRIDGNAAFRRLHALTGADPMEHASIGKGALVKALKSADVDVDEVLTAMAEAGETKESPAVRWAWRSK